METVSCHPKYPKKKKKKCNPPCQGNNFEGISRML
jgi:hypothetical protein